MTNAAQSGVIESRTEFKDTPAGQYEYWSEEIRASLKSRREWHKYADRIVKRYLDRRKNSYVDAEVQSNDTRLNLFHSNVATLTSMLYGNIPTVDVSRRYADANDDVARVAAEILERMLNNDIAENGEEINSVLRSTLQDRLLSGLGCARVRYEVETEKEMVAVEAIGEDGGVVYEEVAQEKVVHEDAPIDYFFWRDILWGWGRNWSEIPWLGYRVYLTKDEVTERFGKKVAEALEYKRQLVNNDRDSEEDATMSSVWSKAEIWEIWDKNTRTVNFVSLGYDRVLDSKEDPLGLRGFFPSPPFFIANVTTTLYQPVPDYHLAQDLYLEIDNLSTRISILTSAVKAVGVYDSQATGVSRIFQEGFNNQLIPVENWAMFSEKGGIAGQIDWVPLADIVNALDKLREMRAETIGLLHEVTGMSDVMRGGGQGQYEGVGQAQLKAKYGSVRVQALQDEFAVFASNLMQIKAEIISLHFDPQTIAKRANIQYSFDAEIAPQAIQLIKDPEVALMKVEIRPESVAMVDYAQLKAERTDYINALATFMQSAAPLIQQDPNSKPFLLQLLQWGLAGFKGASEIEGVIDKAITESQEAAKNNQGKPDPAQMQAQMEMQREQQKLQGEMQKIQAKAQADAQIREQDMRMDIQTQMAAHKAKLAEIQAEMQKTIAETQVKLEADLLLEQAQAQSNISQTQAGANAEMEKDVVATALELEKEKSKTALKINEIAASANAKIRESNEAEETKE